MLRYSAIDTFLRCRRAYYYQEVMNIEAKELPQSLWIGKLCAEVLAKLHSEDEYTATKIAKTFSNLFDDYKDQKPGENKRLQALCILYAMLDKYATYEACKNTKGVTEYEWEKTVGSFCIRGTVDLYIEKTKGLYEFKYTTSPDNYNEYTMADQVALYMWGTNTHRATARLFLKPNIRATASDTTKEFISRCKAYFNKKGVRVFQDLTFYQSDFQAYQAEIISRIKVIAKELSVMDDDISNYYQTTKMHCLSPFVCQYLPICKAEGKTSKYTFVTREKGKTPLRNVCLLGKTK